MQLLKRFLLNPFKQFGATFVTLWGLHSGLNRFMALFLMVRKHQDPRGINDPTIPWPEALWLNWCWRCRICPGHLPLYVSCGEGWFFGGEKIASGETLSQPKKLGNCPHTILRFGFPQKKKNRGSAMSPFFRDWLWLATVHHSVAPVIFWAGPHDELEELHIHQATNHGSRGCLRDDPTVEGGFSMKKFDIENHQLYTKKIEMKYLYRYTLKVSGTFSIREIQ